MAKGIDQFTKEQFEAALPKHKQTGEALCLALGLIDGEYCYTLPIGPDPVAAIMIRSSIGASGVAAGVGKDSIRCWLVRSIDGELLPWGSKVSRYVTRQKGWEGRLKANLGVLYKMGMFIKPCPTCHKSYLKIFITRHGFNEGKLFVSCDCKRYFKWLVEGEDKRWSLQSGTGKYEKPKGEQR